MIIYISTEKSAHALLAQLDRVTGYEPVGQGFESLTARQTEILSKISAGLLFLIGEYIDMIKIDLVTGFLGSGKTTFILKYAGYFLGQGKKIGILENDYGAVNVDTMLLGEIEGDNCIIESVAGACDADCHRRRFKTKLIALGMLGLDRVIIEPSGIFDVDEFFDVLYEEPLDRWYERGSVISVVDANMKDGLSEQSEYLLGSQCANAGAILLSRTEGADQSDIDNTVSYLNGIMEKIGCKRRLKDEIISKPWGNLDNRDYKMLSECGSVSENYVKSLSEDNGYSSFYYMNKNIGGEKLCGICEEIFKNEHGVFRIKGFVRENGRYLRVNAVEDNIDTEFVKNGQEIIIVIGENMDRERIDRYFS